MPKLFGIDIEREVARAMGGGLLPATLIKVAPGERDPAHLSAGTQPRERKYTCRGLLEDYTESQVDGTVVQKGDRRILLLGGTLPRGVFPEAGDRVSIEGQLFNVVGVVRDPAAASYSCQARK